MRGTSRQDALGGAIARALSFLEARRKPTGEFPNEPWTIFAPDPMADASVFPAALIAHGLSAATEADSMRDVAMLVRDEQAVRVFEAAFDDDLRDFVGRWCGLRRGHPSTSC